MIAFLLVILQSCDNNGQATTTNNPSPAANNNADFTENDLMYNGKKLRLTKHARCRMDCRFIDAYEINEVIQQNKVNERKTKRQAQPCPSIAYEGTTRDGQQARIVIGACEQKSPVVITVIDLKNDYQCACK